MYRKTAENTNTIPNSVKKLYSNPESLINLWFLYFKTIIKIRNDIKIPNIDTDKSAMVSECKYGTYVGHCTISDIVVGDV